MYITLTRPNITHYQSKSSVRCTLHARFNQALDRRFTKTDAAFIRRNEAFIQTEQSYRQIELPYRHINQIWRYQINSYTIDAMRTKKNSSEILISRPKWNSRSPVFPLEFPPIFSSVLCLPLASRTWLPLVQS